MTQRLTHDLFEPHVGTVFSVQADNVALELVLAKVDLAGTARDGFQPFALLFEGPEQPLLQQQIVPLHHERLGDIAPFLTHVGSRDGVAVYEAVFN
ncbi:MAG: hypothetical protein P8Z78_03570 [Gammaproteobacteria bacterium]|jgi:hypothetical protein